MRFQGKVAVVTGGASGIGRKVSEILAAEGAHVVVADRDEILAKETCDALMEAGARKAIPVRMDVAEEADILELARIVQEEFGRADVLVNNAAARVWGPVTEVTLESWHRITMINLISVGMVSKHIIPLMVASGGGAIVNISSANGVVGRPGMAQYDATKAGVLGLTRSMACDHAHQNIRVNAILPGPTLTDFHKNRAKDEGREIDPQIVEPHEDGPGIQRRQGRPEEIAHPVVFLASDEASFITGACLAPDGGLSALSGRLG
ncbi:SDR family NAD(P)-dependent oxidoreductase [Pseudarthrobacter sp. DSP2-3-2b1]|uniref:SDR family NAD(P)-dependent oxidoreductase n=1 Tax=Pseudarthrobacter sp. DSP2-3-2b1 TaxID=2804661 RepID=UPI003CF3349C